MSGVREARDGGRRRPATRSGTRRGLPRSPWADAEMDAQRLDGGQMRALEHMLNSHPAVQAAKTLLHSQLLSGGVVMMRGGSILKTVDYGETDEKGTRVQGVTKDFARHLDDHWVPFAREVIDAFLKWGVCPVVFDRPRARSVSDALQELRRELTRGEPDGFSSPSASAPNRARGKNLPGQARARDGGAPREEAVVLVPCVPQLGTYDIAWSPGGRYGYVRDYFLYSTAPSSNATRDETAMVFVKQHPDDSGSVNSPLAAVYDLGSFVSSLVELAFSAELSRSQPSIVTQLRPQKPQNDITANSLFFDSESREMAAGAEDAESRAAARALEMQRALARVINDFTMRGGSTGGQRGASSIPIAPEVPPRLFTLPKDQEIAPHVQVPQPRGDLEPLMRLQIEQFCAALGVPASLVFEGRYSGKSTQQLQLLNSTVSELGKAVSDVLTRVYRALYDDDSVDKASDSVQLKLMTSSVSSIDEVINLYGSGLVDAELAIPSVAHNLGMSAEEAERALSRAKKREAEASALADEERAERKASRTLVSGASTGGQQ